VTSTLLLNVAAAVVAIVSAPLAVGFAAAARAKASGLHGPSVVQPYFQIRKLLTKDYLAPESASALYWLGPLVGTGAVLAALASVPAAGGIDLPTSDAVVIAYLLMLATFLQVVSALDTGTAFGGMGASRESMVAALAEPGLMIAVLGLTVPAGTTRLAEALSTPAQGPMAAAGHAALALSLLLLGLAENSRMPFDNPTTHLELTMIHEAMVLEQSGPGIALVHLQSSLKLTLFWLLALSVAFPGFSPSNLGPVVLAAVPVLLAAGGVLLGLTEAWLVKVRLFRGPDLLVVGFAMALFGLIVEVIA